MRVCRWEIGMLCVWLRVGRMDRVLWMHATYCCVWVIVSGVDVEVRRLRLRFLWLSLTSWTLLGLLGLALLLFHLQVVANIMFAHHGMLIES